MVFDMELNPDDNKAVNGEILLGFWKAHILHHAAEGPLIGQWMMRELRRHGYDVSPGTLYPMLKRMEKSGWLRSETDPGRGPKSARRYYLTDKGQAVLDHVGRQVKELHQELTKSPYSNLEKA